MCESVKEASCYFLLRQKLEKETGKKFPECLEYIEDTGQFCVTENKYKETEFECDCDRTKFKGIHSHCLCGVGITRINIFKNTITNKEIAIGSTCIENLAQDISNYMENKEEFKRMYMRWIAILQKINTKYKNCKKCNKPWDSPRCFHKGLCVDCRSKKKELDKEICILPKFKGQSLIKVYEANPSYFSFCIEKQTRQYETFKEYLSYC